MVLHMDEKTPHLHIDYVPVATGYKKGLKVRNSLSKALENQGFSNETRNQYNNSLLSWQKREREQLKEICKQHGIDTIELGIKRDDMELEVYKEYAKLNSIKEELKEVNEKAEQLKHQTDYYEERVALIDEIKYGVFAGKKAEEDNKALQYENKKLMDEKDRLQKENQELKEEAGYWKLLYQGIMTYTGDKRKKAMEMINKLMNRGKIHFRPI